VLESLAIVYANLQLRRVAEIAPPSLADLGGYSGPWNVRVFGGQARGVEAEMLLLGGARTREQVVEHVETPLTRRYGGDPAPLEAMVEHLCTDQGRMGHRRAVVLQLQEQTGLGGRVGGDGLCGRQGVEDERGQRDLCRQRRARVGEQRGEEVGAKGRLARTALSQEHDGLVLSPSGHPSQCPSCQLFGFAHGAALCSAIGAFCGRGVRVDGDYALVREPGGGKIYVVSGTEGQTCALTLGGDTLGRVFFFSPAGQVGSQMGVRLQMGRQCRQRSLGVCRTRGRHADDERVVSPPYSMCMCVCVFMCVCSSLGTWSTVER
jgi:hypothetical protein